MCRVLGVHASGFYAWLRGELKPMAERRARLGKLARQSWLESGGVYGYRKVHYDLLDAGELCSPNTVARIMQQAGLRAQVGYRRRPGKYGTKLAVMAANRLQQDFNVDAPDKVWVTDITYIRTHEGWLYLAAVIDLFSRALSEARKSSWAARWSLVHAVSYAYETRPRCSHDGRLETSSGAGCGRPLRPRIAVLKSGVAIVSRRP